MHSCKGYIADSGAVALLWNRKGFGRRLPALSRRDGSALNHIGKKQMSIQRRTAYFVQPRGKQVRFTGWAHVVTTLGTMAEPFEVYNRHSRDTDFADWDPSDPMARIDDLKSVAFDEAPFYDGDGVERRQLHGGNTTPATQPVTGKF